MFQQSESFANKFKAELCSAAALLSPKNKGEDQGEG